MDGSARQEPTTADQNGEEDAEFQRLLSSAGNDEREQVLREIVRTKATGILNTPIDDDSNFLENGLNSLTALELTKTLMNICDLEIPMVAIVEHPTPEQLGRHLYEELSDTAAH